MHCLRQSEVIHDVSVSAAPVTSMTQPTDDKRVAVVTFILKQDSDFAKLMRVIEHYNQTGVWPDPPVTPPLPPVPPRQLLVRTTSGLNLREGATKVAKVVTMLAQGEQLTAFEFDKPVKADSLDWVRVRTVEGKEGWVAKKYLVPV